MAIAHGWLPAFDQAAECEALLSSNGYNAFRIYREFISQFAVQPEDIAIHKLCYLEFCKVLATSAQVLTGHPVECGSTYYKSALLDEKRLALAQRAGFDDYRTWRDIAKPAHWEAEPDPLLRAQSHHIIPQGQEISQRYYGTLRDRAVAALKNEAARFSEGRMDFFLRQNRLDAFEAISCKCLTHLGFKPAPTRLKDYVALDLDISDDLVLRWSIGENHPFFVINSPAICQPTLHMRQRSFKQKLRNTKAETRLLVFPYALLVEGVKDVYARCSDVRELEVIVRVHTLMVEWALPYILVAVKSVLNNKPAA